MIQEGPSRRNGMPRPKDEKGRICFDCSHHFPATVDEPTEFGIRLNDQEFEL